MSNFFQSTRSFDSRTLAPVEPNHGLRLNVRDMEADGLDMSCCTYVCLACGSAGFNDSTAVRDRQAFMFDYTCHDGATFVFRSA